MNALLFTYLSMTLAAITLAGEITIQSTLSTRVILRSNAPQQIQIEGTYQSHNFGNDTAFDAYPQIELGRDQWKGEKRVHAPGQKHQWNFSFSVANPLRECEEKKLGCSSTAGIVPLKLQYHYQDSQNHAASISEIHPLIIGNSKEPNVQNDPDLVLSLTRSAPVPFVSKVTVKNVATFKKWVRISMHSSKDITIRITSKSNEFWLAPNEVAKLESVVENLSALEGSVYPIYCVVESIRNQERRQTNSVQSIRIESTSGEQLSTQLSFYLWLSLLAFVGEIFTLRLIIRRARICDLGR